VDDKNDANFVGELLEASLKRLRSEEPRAGLESRILASVRSSDYAAQPRRWVWAWALAVSAAALIVAVVVLRFTSRPAPRTATVSPAVQAVAPKAETPKAVAVALPMSRVPGRPVRPSRSLAPEFRRPEQFPTPSPLTEQEKLLLRYVRGIPPSGPRELGDLAGAQDLKLSELFIPDLDVDEPLGTTRESPTK